METTEKGTKLNLNAMNLNGPISSTKSELNLYKIKHKICTKSDLKPTKSNWNLYKIGAYSHLKINHHKYIIESLEILSRELLDDAFWVEEG